MANRAWRYERAFEAYLRARRLPVVPVVETRRAHAGGALVKSLDFIVAGPAGRILLFDVKGRAMGARGHVDFWATQDDLDGLAAWRREFGPHAAAALAFVLAVPAPELARGFADRWTHDGTTYVGVGVELDAFRAGMTPRSVQWRTHNLRRGMAAALARPLSAWLDPLLARPAG